MTACVLPGIWFILSITVHTVEWHKILELFSVLIFLKRRCLCILAALNYDFARVRTKSSVPQFNKMVFLAKKKWSEITLFWASLEWRSGARLIIASVVFVSPPRWPDSYPSSGLNPYLALMLPVSCSKWGLPCTLSSVGASYVSYFVPPLISTIGTYTVFFWVGEYHVVSFWWKWVDWKWKVVQGQGKKFIKFKNNQFGTNKKTTKIESSFDYSKAIELMFLFCCKLNLNRERSRRTYVSAVTECMQVKYSITAWKIWYTLIASILRWHGANSFFSFPWSSQKLKCFCFLRDGLRH